MRALFDRIILPYLVEENGSLISFAECITVLLKLIINFNTVKDQQLLPKRNLNVSLMLVQTIPRYWRLALTLKMTTAWVVETSVTVNNSRGLRSPGRPLPPPLLRSPPPLPPTYEMTPGFQPFTHWRLYWTKINPFTARIKGVS